VSVDIKGDRFASRRVIETLEADQRRLLREHSFIRSLQPTEFAVNQMPSLPTGFAYAVLVQRGGRGQKPRRLICVCDRFAKA
jgi:hypothetical protein